MVPNKEAKVFLPTLRPRFFQDVQKHALRKNWDQLCLRYCESQAHFSRTLETADYSPATGLLTEASPATCSFKNYKQIFMKSYQWASTPGGCRSGNSLGQLPSGQAVRCPGVEGKELSWKLSPALKLTPYTRGTLP